VLPVLCHLQSANNKFVPVVSVSDSAMLFSVDCKRRPLSEHGHRCCCCQDSALHGNTTLVWVLFTLTSAVLVNKREKITIEHQQWKTSPKYGCHGNTVYIWSANCPFHLYHETETDFRIESETGLANRLRPNTMIYTF